MTKKLLCTLLGVISWTLGNSQLRQLNDVPLYAESGINQERGLARFYEPEIKDSLKVWVKVDIFFKNVLGENVKPEVKSTAVIEYIAKPFTSKYPESAFTLTAGQCLCKQPWEFGFWKRYTPYITDWYQKVPYEKINLKPYYGLDKLSFTGVFVITPIDK